MYSDAALQKIPLKGNCLVVCVCLFGALGSENCYCARRDHLRALARTPGAASFRRHQGAAGSLLGGAGKNPQRASSPKPVNGPLKNVGRNKRTYSPP